MGQELVKEEKNSDSSTLFFTQKFESASVQLLTSATNRCVEIVHEKLFEAMNTFLPIKPAKQASKKY